MTADQRFAALAHAQLPAARQRLADYVALESPTGDAAALDSLADVLTSTYAELGGEVSRVAAETGDHVVASFGQDGAHLVVLGHHDTVWPLGQLAGAMPYVDDGELIRGPGVFDMKGGLVVFETALRILREAGVEPAQGVRLVVTADEEIGSPTGRAVVEAQLAGAAGVLGLEPPHPKGGLKTGRHGSTRVRLRTTGVEAHAALDRTRGVSAIDELVDQLVRVRELCADEPGVILNIGTIGGGTRTNVTAGEAVADLGLRFADGDCERRVLGALTGSAPIRDNAGVSAEILTSRPAWSAAPGSEHDSWLLSHVRTAGAAVGQEVRGAPALGAADTNLAGSAGVPTLDGFGPIGRGAHALHEEIRAESLADRAALLAAVLATPLTP